jgi:hypothetical protein
MFEKIILRRSDKGPTLTAGELAEALLFYQNVHLVLDFGSLNGLITQIGMPNLVALVSRPNVSAVYCQNQLATHTETKNNIATHAFIAYSIAGDQEYGQLTSRRKVLEFILIKKHGYDKKRAKRLVERFRLKVPFRDLTSDHFISGGIVEAAQQDLSDDSFIHDSVILALRDTIGTENVPKNFIYKAHLNDSKFQIETDLNFEDINAFIKKKGVKDGDISPAHLIGNVLNARADTIFSSYYGGEFYTSNLTSDIIRLKYSELLRRIGIEKNELKEFSEIVISTGPSLREVINSKERSFNEFLIVLDKSKRFREWAKGVNPDEKLVKEYWSEVSSEGWIDKLPSKALRYALGTAIGAIEPITGHAVSVADTFLLDKIIGGWRPSHFIDNTLKPFIDKNE